MMATRRAAERWLGVVPPFGILAVVAWCVATRGGTDARDLGVVCAVLAAAFLSAAVSAHRLPAMPMGGSAAVLALLAWVIIDGPLRSGLDVETVRVPMLVSAAVLTVGTVSLLCWTRRTLLLRGFIVLGTVHALITVAGTIRDYASCMCASPSRAESLLVTTGTLTAREVQRRWTPFLGAALGLQAVALLLTGSRLALLTALCVIVWYGMTRATRIGRAALVPWIVIAVVVVAVRFVRAMPDQRWYLWIAAAHRIAAQPIAGHGPTPEVYTLPLARARLTTQAHNEILQWTADYGLIGLALLVAVLVVAFRSVHHPAQHDRWLVAAASSVLASGLADFTLRITAVTVMAAALAAVAFMPVPEPLRVSRSATLDGRHDPMRA
jgi:O-Antigen ligase